MNKRQKRGLVWLALGVLFVLSALGVHVLQQQEDVAAGKTASVLLQQMDDAEISDNAQDAALPERTYMGYTLIGSIEIPSLQIQLPVLNDWNTKMLKAAPCRYEGGISNGNMMIMAHNYKHHFGPLQTVKVGAQVTFKNTTGTVFRYRVAKIEYLHRTKGEDLPSDTYPLTLFTCTASGMERVVVRCEWDDTSGI